VEITLRSDKDPIIYIFRNNLEDLSASSSELSIAGIVLIVVSGVLLIIPIVYWLRARKRSLYRPHFDAEMSEIPKISRV
jgi:hypothetical protein